MSMKTKKTYENWRQDVIVAFTEDFWNMHEDWIWERHQQCEEWMKTLYEKKLDHIKAAAIIERAYNIYL